MAHQLKLLKDDFFASDQQAVAVADRYPQDVFAEHTHDFCELVIVWRGNGLHVLNDRPYRITRDGATAPSCASQFLVFAAPTPRPDRHG